MKRVVVSICIGAGSAFAMFSPIGDALSDTPGGRFIFMPGEWILAVMRDLDVLPHGDAGFIGIPIAVILEGVIFGGVVGCVLECRHRRKKASHKAVQPAAGDSAPTHG
jgi:hypothetical protein